MVGNFRGTKTNKRNIILHNGLQSWIIANSNLHPTKHFAPAIDLYFGVGLDMGENPNWLHQFVEEIVPAFQQLTTSRKLRDSLKMSLAYRKQLLPIR